MELPVLQRLKQVLVGRPSAPGRPISHPVPTRPTDPKLGVYAHYVYHSVSFMERFVY